MCNVRYVCVRVLCVCVCVCVYPQVLPSLRSDSLGVNVVKATGAVLSARHGAERMTNAWHSGALTVDQVCDTHTHTHTYMYGHAHTHRHQPLVQASGVSPIVGVHLH